MVFPVIIKDGLLINTYKNIVIITKKTPTNIIIKTYYYYQPFSR